MSKNTSVILGKHFESFIAARIGEGRFLSSSEAVREGLRLLEEREVRLDALRQMLATGEAQLDRGEGVDGEAFMSDLMDG